MKLEVSLPSPARVTRALVLVVVALLALSTLGQAAKHLGGHTQLKGLVPAFYVDSEPSVPTWWSSLGLALAAAALALIAAWKTSAGDPFRRHWAILAAGFLFLSIDEVAMFHELPIDALRAALGTGGLLYYAWVLPGAAVAAAVGLSFTRFLLHLPPKTRWLFLLAGTVYLGGALGVEMLSGLAADGAGEETFAYAMVVTVEEACEMFGVVLFLHALLDYLAASFGRVVVQTA